MKTSCCGDVFFYGDDKLVVVDINTVKVFGDDVTKGEDAEDEQQRS